MGCADLHVQMGIADGIADLLVSPSGGEHGEGGREGDQAHGGQARSHVNHIGLGNAAVKVAVGVSFLENTGLGCARQVRVQNHQVGGGRAQLLQGVAVAVAGGDVLHFSHDYTSNAARAAASSAMPLAYSSSLGALPCQPALSSM